MKLLKLTLISATIATVAATTGCSHQPTAEESRVIITPSQQMTTLNPGKKIERSPSNAQNAVSAEDSTSVKPLAESTPTLEIAVLPLLDQAPEADPQEEQSAVMESTPPEVSRPAKTVFRHNFDSYQLSADDMDIIKQHGRFLTEHPELKIKVHGHADAQGFDGYNRTLAAKRAYKVVELLKQEGVLPDQIEYFGWGSDIPASAVTDWKDNRRTEILYEEEYVKNSY